MILKHSQSSSSLELLFFKTEQVLPHFSDFIAHF